VHDHAAAAAATRVRSTFLALRSQYRVAAIGRDAQIDSIP